ncbi:MFS transporter [Aquincola sp. S2]|uniref:MFS transporter n=1 Tax=Pseudaquabacterium terrae TaxID=2732868 RepID=A0ABX2EFQ9_9BURK|nr:MFS transporter [Aquabacterium terrae]NRF67472.1 MFS transporter [Aquabacterium terrae]
MSKFLIAERPVDLLVGRAGTPSIRWALASLSLTMGLSSLGTSIAHVGLPTLAQAFDASFSQVQSVVIAYLLAVTTSIVVVGRLGDLLGRRRLLLAGIVLFTAASVLCGIAPTLGLLVAARAAQGLGAAILLSLSMALVGETVPKTRSGRAMGLLGTMSALGTALGPSLGGFLIAGFGWRALFLVNVPLGILGFVLARRHLPVARAEASAASPSIPWAMFRDPVRNGGLAMSALVSAVMMATLVVGPFYLSRALGLDAAMVGLVMSIGPLVSALAGVPAGRCTDRFGTPRMTWVGLVALALGCVALSAMPATLGIAGYVGPLVVLTAGYALFQAANNTAVMADVGPDQRGVVSGLLNLARNLGLLAGASAMGAVFALAAATADVTTAPPAAVAAGLRVTFAVAAALVVVALAIAVRQHARISARGAP